MLLDGKLVKNKLLENLENEFKSIKTTLVVIQVTLQVVNILGRKKRWLISWVFNLN